MCVGLGGIALASMLAKEEAEAKRKAEELQNLKNDIKANFIKKGDLRDRIILQDMTDPHGNIGE